MHSHCSPRSWSTSSSAAYSAQNASHRPLARRTAARAFPQRSTQAVEVGVAAHVDAAPERGVVARGAAPGAAHPRGPHEDLDVVEPAEDDRERVRRQRRPAPCSIGWARVRRSGAGPAREGGGRRQPRRRCGAPRARDGRRRTRGGGGCGVVGLASEGSRRGQP